MTHQAGAYPGFCSKKRLGVFLIPSLDGMLVHLRATTNIKFAGTHLFIWLERHCESMEFLTIECQRISRKLNISAAREQQGKGLGP